MKIDNSQMMAWWTCPLKWKERYGEGIEPITRAGDSLLFGTRIHQLLEGRHKVLLGGVEVPTFPPLEDAELEAEAQATFAAYEAHYPEEEFEVVDVEKYFEVPAGKHIYCGEFDGIVRMPSGKLWLLETKTQKRGSKNNHPDAWRQRSQVGLYLWAAQEVYGSEFEGILLNIITRGSPKGQEGPGFRRDNLVRTAEQMREAVRNIIWVADQIERGEFVPDRNQCVGPLGWRCDYYELHSNEERSDSLVRIKFKKAEEYLSGL